jgi:nicotinic acid mononucleotide adenylyltransferase
VPQIQIQIEDFGGNFAMLHYGHLHPSADYFNSNLMMSNFVVADLINNNNDVFFYDERTPGKDVDALCSL